MDRQEMQIAPSHAIAPWEIVPRPAGGPGEQEELGFEELDERLTPGSWLLCLVKKTAGWGC